MALICEMNQDEWEAWVNTRPPVVQRMCRSHPPNRLYKDTVTGNVVVVKGYNEAGTLTLLYITPMAMLTGIVGKVIGVDPDQVEETDAPQWLDDVEDLISLLGE